MGGDGLVWWWARNGGEDQALSAEVGILARLSTRESFHSAGFATHAQPSSPQMSYS